MIKILSVTTSAVNLEEIVNIEIKKVVDSTIGFKIISTAIATVIPQDTHDIICVYTCTYSIEDIKEA